MAAGAGGASVATGASVAAGAAGASVATGTAVAAVEVVSAVMELAALVACGSEGHGVLPVSASEATTPAFPAVDRSVLPKVMELVSTAPTPPSATQVAANIANFVTCILRCLVRPVRR